MDLTDEQWALIQPLLPPPSPFARGRPSADPRWVMNGIFYKLRLGFPWYILPPRAERQLPSWQTCYRAYRRWSSTGLLDQVFTRLEQHLRQRGGFDLLASLWLELPSASPAYFRVTHLVSSLSSPAGGAPGPPHPGSELVASAPDHAAVIIQIAGSRWRLRLTPDLENTWQGATALLLAQDFVSRLKTQLKFVP